LKSRKAERCGGARKTSRKGRQDRWARIIVFDPNIFKKREYDLRGTKNRYRTQREKIDDQMEKNRDKNGSGGKRGERRDALRLKSKKRHEESQVTRIPLDEKG